MLKYLLFLLAVPIFAQTNAQTVYVTNTPSGACSARTNLRLLTPTGVLYTCQSGTWGAVGGGGGGSCGSLGGDVTGTCAANTIKTSVALAGSPTTTTQTTGDGTTKISTDAFVANALQSINPATNVQVATTTVLPNTPTYSNGTAGVGATLTAGSNTTLAAIDGYSVLLNDRILIKNQATTANNGCYTLTQTGSGSLPWILTRCVDYNTPTNINYTGFICTIQTGSTYASDTCFSLDNLISAVGTSAITYTQQASGASAGKPGGGVQIIGSVTAGDALKVASGASGKNIQDAGVAFSSLTRTIASGAKALNTTAVSANTCGTAQTDTATGTLTTDAISWAPNADITAVTGYNVAGTFGLEIFAYPTADTINFKVCNTTSSSITPGSAITLNWRVTR